MIKYIIAIGTAGILIYYIKQSQSQQSKILNKVILQDAQTQTATVATVTPPNETNLPDFITVDKPDSIEPSTTPPRRTTSFASFFKVF
uniref:Uncharacterized protein n=1 Tax=viral metagenome TaxID=1070528 RepID=A0A6C0HGX2_9ZZZZ